MSIQSKLCHRKCCLSETTGVFKTTDGPDFFSIIYWNKTTDFFNLYLLKNLIFRRDSLVPIKEITIKLPFKIQVRIANNNVTHGDRDFFVRASSIYTPK